jgi:hypothetical protein
MLNIISWWQFFKWKREIKKFLSLGNNENPVELFLALQSSNINSENLSIGTPSLNGKVKRWNLENGYIPVFDNNDIRAKRAMDIVELATGMTFFQRGASKAEIEKENFGLIFTKGKAAPKQNTNVDENCKGSVGESEHSGSFPYDLCHPISGKFQRPLYVNLDGPKPNGGKADLEVTIHELAHALGLEDEFEGFGKGGSPISIKMFCVLKKLYKAPLAAG